MVLRGLRGPRGTEEKLDQKDSRQLWRCTEILETLETLGPQVSLVVKEKGASQGHRALTAEPEDLEMVDRKDLLETPAEMEREVLLVLVDSTVTKERWGSQVLKVGKVVQGLVGNLDQVEYQDQEDLKVLKEKQVHLDPDQKDLQKRREIQDVQEHQVQRGNRETLETLVPQEPVAPVAPKDILDPKDAEVLLGLLVERVVMVLRGQMALQDPPASQVPRGLLEFLVQPVPEETRDRMGYLDLLERKEQWVLLEPGPGAQMGRRVHLGIPGSRVLLVSVVHLVPMVLGETQVVLVLLDLLVLLVVPARRESALKEAKEKMDCLEDKDQKVRQAFGVLLVLQVLVLKERRDLKEQQVSKDHLVTLVTLALEANRVKTDHQALEDLKARWDPLVSQDLLV